MTTATFVFLAGGSSRAPDGKTRRRSSFPQGSGSFHPDGPNLGRALGGRSDRPCQVFLRWDSYAATRERPHELLLWRCYAPSARIHADGGYGRSFG
jgi:hypothetical protein